MCSLSIEFIIFINSGNLLWLFLNNNIKFLLEIFLSYFGVPKFLKKLPLYPAASFATSSSFSSRTKFAKIFCWNIVYFILINWFISTFFTRLIYFPYKLNIISLFYSLILIDNIFSRYLKKVSKSTLLKLSSTSEFFFKF